MLGRLERVNVRDIWPNEVFDFTPWLAQNLQILGEALCMELSLQGIEQNVRPFRANIIAYDKSTNEKIIIENQLGRTDHTHLGQITTYASTVRSNTLIWIAEIFTLEHRTAIDWLNEFGGEQIRVFGVEIEVWKIGNDLAPHFHIVASPNREIKSKKSVRPNTEHFAPTSQADRIRNLLLENPSLSVRTLAQLVGLSTSTTHKWKKRIENEQ